MVECSFTNQVVVSSSPVSVTQTSDITPVLSKEFLDLQATTECRFTLKLVRDMQNLHCFIVIADDKIFSLNV